jgi:hypothetical protein
MSDIFPNFVPRHGDTLLDALTLEYGPRHLIVPLMVRANIAAREMGIELRIRHDFETLAELNSRELSKGQKGNWFKLVNMLNPDYGISARDGYWISGENEKGEIVVTVGGRVYHWPETTLYDEARMMFYGGRDLGQDCRITAEITKTITGVVNCASAMWVRPDYRGRQLARLIPRVSRAYVSSRWPIDSAFIFTQPDVHPKVIKAYGYPTVDHSVFFPNSPWGDLQLAVARITRQEIYDDLAAFLANDLADDDTSDGASPSILIKRDERVTKTSPEPVLQGSMSLS